MTSSTSVTIDKFWDENERVREGVNGRVYVSTAGRWQWAVNVGGETVAVYDSAREARRRAADESAAPVPESRRCPRCGDVGPADRSCGCFDNGSQ